MALTPEEVHHAATLARLALTPEEAARAATQLAPVVEALQALAAGEVAPSLPPLPPTGGPLREDVVRPGLAREEALANAPQVVEGAFAVPRVLD